MKALEFCMPWPELQVQLHQLKQAAHNEDLPAIKAVLLACVQGYHEQVL